MEINPLSSTLVLLFSGVLSMGLSRQLSISPILGFFVTGALIGEQGFALVDHRTDAFHVLAELGVCFLLFDVGLHLSIKALAKQWRSFFGLGFGQVAICGTLVAAAAMMLDLTPPAAIVLGLTLSLSSTALVLKILQDHGESDSPVGQRATEILVFQDLVAVFLLVILHGLQNTSGELLPLVGRSIVNIGLAVAFVAFVGRVLLKPFFAWIVRIKSDEVFTASALLFVLFTCWVTQGLGLSLALGAFLAGVTLTESSYSYLVRSEIAPFRGLLLSLFFLSIGMSLDLGLMLSQFHIVLALTLGLMALKAVGLILAGRLAGIPVDAGTRLSFLLSQGSEFGFVILGLGLSAGLIQPTIAALASGVIGMSLLLTPLVGGCGCFLSRCLAKLETSSSLPDGQLADKGEVVIVEFDEVGRALASALVEIGIPYRGHDRDWGRIAYAKSRGYNVHFADLDRPRTLSRASIGEVRAVVCLVEDDNIVRILIEGLRKIAPQTPLVGATREAARLDLYEQLGIEDVFIKNERAAENTFRALLSNLGYSEQQVREAVARCFPDEEVELFPRATIQEALPIDDRGGFATAA